MTDQAVLDTLTLTLTAEETEALGRALEVLVTLTGDPDATRLCRYIASEITKQKLRAA